MIQELLISAINETATYNYVITEFQLGEEPMRLLLKECEGISNRPQKGSKVREYMGIPVVEHPSKDAVMFGIKVREYVPPTYNNITTKDIREAIEQLKASNIKRDEIILTEFNEQYYKLSGGAHGIIEKKAWDEALIKAAKG